MIALAATAALGMPAVLATPPGERAVNHRSMLVLGDFPKGAYIPSGGSTGPGTLVTLRVDVSGDTLDPTLLVAIDRARDERDPGASILDPWSLDELDGFTAPRLVDWGCEDVLRVDHGVAAGRGCLLVVGCAGLEPGLGLVQAAAWVADDQPDARYGALSLDRVDDGSPEVMEEWLAARDLVVPEGAIEALAGWRVVALRVELLEPPVEPVWLPAVQVFAQGDPAIDLRLGATSSAGVQDVVVTVLGREGMRIANYPEVDAETACLTEAAPDDFADAYDADLDRRLEPGTGRAAWTTEGRGDLVCEVCTNSLPREAPRANSRPRERPRANSRGRETGVAGGFPAGSGSWPAEIDPEALSLLGPKHAVASRLHLRYTPDQVDEPLVLEPDPREVVPWMAHHREELETRLPLCGEGWAPDPGDCPASEVGAPRCRSSGGGAGWPWLLAMALASRRRR